MRLIGLTGGIATGKSTVARMLAARGAVVVDADRIAREIVEPGKPAYDAVVRRFGREILAPDGTINRPKLAAIVFADDAARADLEAITHPEVAAEMSRRIEEHRDTDHVVVADIPLLVEAGSSGGFDAVLVVVAGPDQQVDRLERNRGTTKEDAGARIAAQASSDARRAVATHVIENTGSIGELELAVDEFWRGITARA